MGQETCPWQQLDCFQHSCLDIPAGGWRNFETALPCLRFFKYDPLPGNHLLEDERSWFVGYAIRRAGRRFIRNFDEDPVDITSDGVAYASLQRVVEERRS